MTVRLSGPDRSSGLPVVDRRRLRSRAARALRALGHSRSELSVALVSDDEIRALNERYRDKGEPTDVLSFSLVQGPAVEYRGALLGDVVIGLETAARQARRARRSLDDEVARLMIHGVLHVLGHDHEDAGQAKAMQSEERRVWRAVREPAR